MKKAILFTLSLLSGITLAQTNVSGGIYTSETWTTAGSPYVVSGNLVLFEGVDLTVEPGVHVQFNPGASLEVRGKLIAIGTETDSIYFTSSLSSPVMNSWNGIKVIGTDTSNPIDQVTMHYVKGMYAHTFIDLDAAYQGPYNFKHCYFAQNSKVNEDGGMPSTNFDYCTFEANAQALDWCQFSNRASHCHFIHNGIGLVGIEKVDTCYFAYNTQYALAPYGVTTGCTIEYNTLGVKTGFNAVNHTFVNNTVVNNHVGMEVNSFFNGSQNFTGNTICNNTEYNLRYLSTNNADLGMNCWCTTDENLIHDGIFDGYDDVSYGLVSVSPASTNCDGPFIAETPEIIAPDFNVSIFPNPFVEAIQFQTDIEQELTLSVYDMFGRQVWNQTFFNQIKIDGNRFDTGMYIYELRSENGQTQSGKLVKK